MTKPPQVGIIYVTHNPEFYGQIVLCQGSNLDDDGMVVTNFRVELNMGEFSKKDYNYLEPIEAI